ncbi:LacI family DNA-binding transcriptional regulator [Streptomyces sp. PLM4]|uniref:LacI family DNA-binding transcriptional regulator n=1 Tax=Streptomyces TaxID=1883 RepID=UPI00205ECE24|nr:LacI family DNA-binding transcriptional regulator [Streptomyces sp. PLM4]BDH72201.1 LacI family transcriptional regulator [Streptomyces sp. PLM4]
MPVPPATPRPTLEAVAARAGVSRATVSRVVNGGAGVTEQLAARVRRAVDELGYVPNRAARALVTRRHDAVAVVIAEPETRVFTDPFFALQLRGISEELTARDAQLVLMLTRGDEDSERVGRYLAGGHVDGALVFSVHLDDPLPGLVRRTGLPAVFGGRPGDLAATPYVDCDNRGGARAAVRHLASLGRRRIAHISGPLDQTSAVDRLDGWRDITGAAGAGLDSAPDLLASGDFTPEGGARAMSTLLERRPDLDAVFAASDLTASGALWTLRGAGLRVPEDVAVVGFDDLRTVAQHTDPPLTTVRQDIEEMGRLMARSLLDAGEGVDRPDSAAPDGIVLPTTLVRRASA